MKANGRLHGSSRPLGAVSSGFKKKPSPVKGAAAKVPPGGSPLYHENRIIWIVLFKMLESRLLQKTVWSVSAAPYILSEADMDLNCSTGCMNVIMLLELQLLPAGSVHPKAHAISTTFAG